ncbi:hypothetical protein [Tepidibacter formicigenes]|jgi:hypothetical protein|uniref:Uncharacterized protein n=1 Tax=Tepidibacter formicigenes DSM 15518 TaxID=1123349 RepID=A0A1M6JFI2_9FIRM|nr:hypothetical protein [Tepidibacter formicigenes]SHJ45405.1 hypothetical protein SAMN02744037_00109 [Tepidibacter formicigenes DSM 15518]
MIKNKKTRKILDSQGIKNFHQMDLEIGNEVTFPNDLKRHTIGSTKPFEKKGESK